MRIGIGIDTGGTCTDAVAYDFESGVLLAKGKALTTRENLAIGIGDALDMLPQEFIRDASLVSLSTTLATNACVEDKGCRAKLIIFGLQEENIHRVDASENYGLRYDSVMCVDTHGSADGLVIDEPDWETFAEENRQWLEDADALAAVELYANYNGAPCEKKFKEIAQKNFGKKCITASELSNGISVLVRGTTALLNARLFPIVHEFVQAAADDFKARGCKAPVMVVRSDGTLMSSQLSMSKPVETILSGPAASVLAGKSFTDDRDYIIIDMGGTTTDVSIVRDGKPVTASEGIKINGWQTYVRGIQVSPFALGGDSAVRLVNGQLQLSPRRVMPLCSAAVRWPEIKQKLEALLETKHMNRFPLHEFFYLVREPEDKSHYDAQELRLIELLKKGPCILERLWNEAKIDLYHFDGERLESEGVIMRCGITPTDFMHIKGDYNEYDREASVLAMRYILQSMGRMDTVEEVDALADEGYRLVQGKMYENLMRIMLARKYPEKFESGIDEQTEYLIRKSWENHDREEDMLFNSGFFTNSALVGIGAPTHVFLPEVARAFKTKCILPEHAEVANAVGALKADINAVVRVNITQRRSVSSGNVYYTVHSPNGSVRIDDFEDAVARAKKDASQAAISEALARGAVGKLEADTRLVRHKAMSQWGMGVEMGATVVSEVEVRLS